MSVQLVCWKCQMLWLQSAAWLAFDAIRLTIASRMILNVGVPKLLPEPAKRTIANGSESNLA